METHGETVQKASSPSKPSPRGRKSRKTLGNSDEHPFKCPRCDLTFPEESLMISHRDDHEEEYQFECGQCDKLFKELESLKQHFYSQHTVSGRQTGMEMGASLPVIEGEFFARNLTSVQSSAVYTTASTPVYTETQSGGVPRVKLKEIIIVDNNVDYPIVDDGPRYKCLECGKVLKSKQVLREHQKRHKQEYKFFCQITDCEKGFKTKQDRDRHEIRAHIPLDQRTEQIVCEICDKRIAHKGLIKDHMRTHTDERPFVCHLCGKGFRQKNALRDHLKSKMHGGEGLSHRNKSRKKKVTTPNKRGRKPKIQEKVEDKDYKRDGSESNQEKDMDGDSPQSDSEMEILQQSQSVAHSLVISQVLPPPPLPAPALTTSPKKHQTRSVMNQFTHQQQLSHQYLHQAATNYSGNISDQPPILRLNHNYPQLISNNHDANSVLYNNQNQQQRLPMPEQFTQQQQSQSVIQQTENYNVILHMPTLTLHDQFQNVYRTS